MKPRHLALFLVLIAGVASAHANVKDPSVKQRMQMMTAIKDATGTLGGMVKNPATFDAARAKAAQKSLSDLARDIPAAFEDKATDPESKASPKVWKEWSGFVRKAGELADAADQIDTSSAADLGASFGPLGQACGSCHKVYKTQ